MMVSGEKGEEYPGASPATTLYPLKHGFSWWHFVSYLVKADALVQSNLRSIVFQMYVCNK